MVESKLTLGSFYHSHPFRSMGSANCRANCGAPYRRKGRSLASGFNRLRGNVFFPADLPKRVEIFDVCL